MQAEMVRPRANPARGIALIATAVVLGLFLMRNAYEDGPSVSTERSAGAAAEGEDAGTTVPGDTGTTTPELRPPAEVKVIVANFAGVQGAAATKTNGIRGAGYQVAAPTNAPGGQRLEATQIQYAEGYEREAADLAQRLGAPANGVVAMPAQPPIAVAGSHILVLLGSDLAQR